MSGAALTTPLAALTASRLERLATFSPEAIAILAPDGTVLYLSPSFTRIFGFTREHIPHIDAWWPLAYPDPAYRADRAAAWAAEVSRALAEGGEVHNFEGKVSCLDGSSRWVECHASFTPDEYYLSLVDISRRKSAEENAARLAGEADRSRRQTEWLNLALDVSSSGIWEWVPETDQHDWSPTTWRLFGLKPGTPSFELWREQVHPDDRRATVSAIREAVEKGLPFQAEYRIALPDGASYWLMVRGTPLAGKPLRYLGIVTDIDESKRAQMRLVEAEERNRSLIEHSELGIVLTDDEGKVLEANPAAQRLLARDEAALRQLGRNEIMDPADPGLATALAERSEKGHFSGELTVIRGDGARIPVYLTSSHFRDRAGRLLASTMFRDISELVHARNDLARQQEALERTVALRTAELAESEQRFRQIANAAPVLIWMSGEDAACNYFNEAWLEFTGRTPEQEMGDGWTVGVHAGDYDRCLDIYRGAFAQRVPFSMEYRLRHRDGRYRWILDRGVPRFAGDGSFLGYIGGCVDIDDMKRVAIEREEARKAAEELARVKSDFLANMSHEIRTPLNGVLGLAEIGHRDSQGRGRAQEAFARILDSGRLLLGIINDILDFSKIEAGKLVLEAAAYSPRRIIEDAVAMQTERAAGKGLSISITLEAGLPAGCLGDPNRVSQILLNLLSNGIKFTERGGVGVTANREGEWLIYTVTDSGIGMSGEQLGRLFTPFEQADSSTTRKYGGTGLGLSISQRLAQLMGGEIRVGSRLGEGSRFELMLPYVAAEVVDDDGGKSAPAARRGVRGGRRLAGLRLLAAEDNAVNRMVLEEFLTREGALVTLVDNGRQAVEAVVAGPGNYDLVLMDVQMPEMDGREATRRIAALAPELPVVGQTAHALAEERRACLDAGMIEVLLKPINYEETVETVRRLAARTGGEVVDPPAEPVVGDVSGSVLARERLRRQYGDQLAFLQRLEQVALKTEGPKPAWLRAAAADGNLAEIARLAHGIKGSAGTLGTDRLIDAAKAAEVAARAGQPAASRLAEDLAGLVDRLLADIREDIGVP